MIRAVESLASALALVSAASLVAVLAHGPYSIELGPLRMAARGLHGPLLLFLALALLRELIRARARNESYVGRLRSPGALFLLVLLVYSASPRTPAETDSTPARYLPFSILRELDFDLDEFGFLYRQRQPFYLVEIDGHMVSAYPPWAAVLALPVYAIPVLCGLPPDSPLVFEIEKLAAALITALSVLALHRVSLRLTREPIGFAIALVYAFGTSSFSTSSQALWQHGPAQLFLALALYCLVRGLEEPRWTAVAGLPLASAILCRPVDLLLALPIGVYVLWRARDRLAGFLVAGLPMLLVLVSYNRRYFGSSMTFGFAGFVFGPGSVGGESGGLFDTPFLEGFAGILASPARGLFVYSPIFLLSLWGMVVAWRRPGNELMKCLSIAPLALALLVAKWVNWFGGWCYGPRLLADATPILALFLVEPFERAARSWLWRVVAVVLAVASVTLHALGAFGDESWNLRLVPDRSGFHAERLWEWSDSPPVHNARRLMGELTGTTPAPPQHRRRGEPRGTPAPGSGVE
jgi:hypothetical protein